MGRCCNPAFRLQSVAKGSPQMQNWESLELVNSYPFPLSSIVEQQMTLVTVLAHIIKERTPEFDDNNDDDILSEIYKNWRASMDWWTLSIAFSFNYKKKLPKICLICHCSSKTIFMSSTPKTHIFFNVHNTMLKIISHAFNSITVVFRSYQVKMSTQESL